jgi:prepilin-type N-terminal cleavage/methylation domain-containing protein
MKENLKKTFKGFSLIEVVIAVNLLALILAILGLSVLGSQKLIINAQTRSEISKIGEGILDYVCSLPISDRIANPALRPDEEGPNNNIYSISDFIDGTINNNTIINQMNSILNSGADTIKIRVVQSISSNNWSPKGRVIQFGADRNNNSYVEVTRVSSGVYQVRVNIIYQTNPRNPNNIKRIVVSRVVAF